MAYQHSKLAPCPVGHINAVWENQGGWHRCYCCLCHSTAQQSRQAHRKWQRRVRTHSTTVKNAMAQGFKPKNENDQRNLPTHT